MRNLYDVQAFVDRERYERFNVMIDSKFTDENIIALMTAFEDRRDGDIQSMVRQTLLIQLFKSRRNILQINRQSADAIQKCLKLPYKNLRNSYARHKERFFLHFGLYKFKQKLRFDFLKSRIVKFVISFQRVFEKIK